MEFGPVISALCLGRDCSHSSGTILDLRDVKEEELKKEEALVALSRHLTDGNVALVILAKPSNQSIKSFNELRGRLRRHLAGEAGNDQFPLLKLVRLDASASEDDGRELGQRLHYLGCAMKNLPELDEAHPGVAAALSKACKEVRTSE
jgi:hypothetical protein